MWHQLEIFKKKWFMFQIGGESILALAYNLIKQSSKLNSVKLKGYI